MSQIVAAELARSESPTPTKARPPSTCGDFRRRSSKRSRCTSTASKNRSTRWAACRASPKRSRSITRRCPVTRRRPTLPRLLRSLRLWPNDLELIDTRSRRATRAHRRFARGRSDVSPARRNVPRLDSIQTRSLPSGCRTPRPNRDAPRRAARSVVPARAREDRDDATSIPRRTFSLPSTSSRRCIRCEGVAATVTQAGACAIDVHAGERPHGGRRSRS